MKIPMTAEEWQLYRSKPGAAKAARALAAATKREVQAALTGQPCRGKRFSQVSAEYRAVGARDSEPIGVFHSIMDSIEACRGILA